MKQSSAKDLSKSTKIDNIKETNDNEKFDFDYQIHPAIARRPEMNESCFNALVLDMFLHGQRNAITLQSKTNILLDGRARLKGCKQLNIEPIVKYFSGTEDEIENLIVSQNERRRHLTVSELACSAFLFLNEAKLKKIRLKAEKRLKETDGNKFKPNMLDILNTSNLRKSVADLYGVSENSIARAKEIYDRSQEHFYKVLNHEILVKDSDEDKYWELSSTKTYLDILEEDAEKEARKKEKGTNTNEAKKQNETPEVIITINDNSKVITFKFSNKNNSGIQEKFVSLSEEARKSITEELSKQLTEIFSQLITKAENHE